MTDKKTAKTRSGPARGKKPAGRRPAVERRRNLALRRQFWWADLPDEELLDLRLCDLGLDTTHGQIPIALARLDDELARRGIRFRPHCWLSEDWFSPDGVPGIAIPFYLAHPCLTRLERRMMHEVEGGNVRWLRRILRHEAGHAIDTAYRLRRRQRWRELFGPASEPYPVSYVPRPGSRRYVMHLGHWYAQSHPTEDFAETFAVWLAPHSTWRNDYADWPALRKLLYVDELMAEVRDVSPPVRSRKYIEPLRESRITLRKYYEDKRVYYDTSETDRYDLPLKRVFASRARHPGRPAASTFIRQVRPQLQRLLIRRSRLHPYLVHNVMRIVIQRTRDLDLCVHHPIRQSKRETFRLLERILFDSIRRGRERYAL